MLLRQGTKRFRTPDATTLAALEAIKDIDRLEAIRESPSRDSRLGRAASDAMNNGSLVGTGTSSLVID